jgi:glycosyltransferase involved in cell wall biosynthesis
MKGMRLALVGPLPPPEGGMANQTRQLARLLDAEGIAVEVVRVNAPYRPRWVGDIHGIRALFRLVPYLLHLVRAAATADLFHILANSGWSWHLFAAPAVWVARLRGKGVVLNYRGGGAEEFFARSFSWVKPTLGATDAVIVPSRFLHDVFGRRGVEARIVPNIIDTARFRPADGGAAAADLMRSFPHLVVTRNLEEIYDNATALQAFQLVKERYPDARLTVAGTGPEKGMLENLAAELGIHDAVTFAGRLESDQVAELYRTADLMLNPSRVDNFPISILEALASGVPVVSTDVGGVPFMVEHGVTARLVRPGDFREMAAEAIGLLDAPRVRHKQLEKGLELSRNYEWEQVRTLLFTVYEDVLNGKRAEGGKDR